MEQIIKILIERLACRGMELGNIPPYIRDLANAISFYGHGDVETLNTRLQLMGWHDFELDDHTLQLIVAILKMPETGTPDSRYTLREGVSMEFEDVDIT